MGEFRLRFITEHRGINTVEAEFVFDSLNEMREFIKKPPIEFKRFIRIFEESFPGERIEEVVKP